MKNLKKWWKLIAVFAVVAIVSIGYVVRSRAFTLIEMQFLPAVQLVANQRAAVNVSNFSTETVTAVIDIFSGNGTLLVTKTVTIMPGQTFILPYIHPTGTFPANIRASVSLDTANATVSDIAAFDVTSGEVNAILPFIKLQ